MGVQYRVLKINQEAEETLELVRDDYYDKICSPKFGDTKLNSNLFEYVSGSVDVTLLYDCTSSSQIEDLSCPKGETYGNVAAVPITVPVSPMCKSKVVVRIKDATGFGILGLENVTGLEQAVREGFEVKCKVDSAKCDECVGTKGVCGYDWGLSETVCYCPNRSSASRNCSATAEAIYNPVLPSAKGTSYEPK
ncbi:LEAF RUST 10 DISEASE-RESISTANCE LOCUS RECEPTOR-LIKE PROTEIN KINASE-like 2.7 [Prunus yedoensis var. nudiflora]|uniref:LEAF RUST 10 DISEASE-RESISTANCE LOCUS RECEPTOR-LIKE PROTEIN KINASE-like 2.7 n=1 Tax=Prunus yedoensis var. nudiflora TaxID=2094558 RepID=A0A314ZSN9_PRUYE|nr:LEAF RUST 10 DISEASE-RESISTANCE LOCUS RECEPTOR-LIKE PROTEIN KINASE-like 2.7 [Prunus yedoensis var. nudiflora]